MAILILFRINRSDPTENDSVEGLRPNARGPGLVTFGVSVTLDLILLSWHHTISCSYYLVAVSYYYIKISIYYL